MKNEGSLHELDEIDRDFVGLLIFFIVFNMPVIFVISVVEMERWSFSPKAPPSARQNACLDCLASVEEREDVEKNRVRKRAESIDRQRFSSGGAAAFRIHE